MTAIVPLRKGLGEESAQVQWRSGHLFIRLPRVARRNTTVQPTAPRRWKTIAALAILFGLAAWTGVHFSETVRATDFPDFYCAARMLANGHAHQLYDANIQYEYQARYAGRIGTLYIHPPFEATFYLPVAWLPIRDAYLLWFLFNLVFLAVTMRVLARLADSPWDWPILTIVSLLFVPVILCLQQGQDSLLLLLLLVLGLAALQRGNSFAAGCWLALGLFKFQIVVPLILVLLLVQRGKPRMQMLKGFTLVAFGLAAFSAAICGWSVFATYPEFLRHLSSQPFAGIHPRAMANFRGLISLVGLNQSALDRSMVAALSITALLLVLSICKRAEAMAQVLGTSSSSHEAESAYGYALIFALLVSYHLNPHDLSVLLIPIFVETRRVRVRRRQSIAQWGIATLMAFLFLPPLHLWGLRSQLYCVLAVPIFLALGIAALSRKREQDPNWHSAA
jgi:hypothetical protein